MELRKLLESRGVTLVAVSKTHPVEKIWTEYEKGQRHFGENRVQELTAKQAVMPSDICWHLIGQLQRNKVKYIAPFVHLIHSVDNLELLLEINKQAEKNNWIIDCLLQFHIARETTKSGMLPDEAIAVLSSPAYASAQHIRICGVMGMATYTEDEDLIRSEFAQLRAIFSLLKDRYFKDRPYFREISMGMSGDYEIAIEEGSTMVRIGSLIFGGR